MRSNDIIQQIQHTFFWYAASKNDIIKIMSFSLCLEAQSPQISLLLNIYLTSFQRQEFFIKIGKTSTWITSAANWPLLLSRTDKLALHARYVGM
jgi:hypothetical protein